MIKHLFRIIWNQRKINAWLFGELMLVFVCLWFVIDFTMTAVVINHEPLGFDIEHTYRVDMMERTPESDNYITPEAKTTALGEDILAVAERIRRNPDVEAVSLSVASQPYAATGFSSQLYYDRLFYKDTVGVTAQRYEVTPSFFYVFNIPSEKYNSQELGQLLNDRSVILTANAKWELMKDESVLGKEIQIGEDSYRKSVVGISQSQRWSEYRKSEPGYFTLLSESHLVSNLNSDNLSNVELCICVKPDQDTPDFTDRFITDMAPQLMVGNLYLMDVRPSSIIRKGVVLPEESEINVRLMLFLFLLVNIFLGVSGTFWLRTQSRKGEMGLRVAVGSTKYKLQWLLVGEGLLILTMAVVPAVVINFNIGVAELASMWTYFTPLRFCLGLFITYFLMAIMIISGIWYPAHRFVQMEPAEALRYE